MLEGSFVKDIIPKWNTTDWHIHKPCLEYLIYQINNVKRSKELPLNHVPQLHVQLETKKSGIYSYSLTQNPKTQNSKKPKLVVTGKTPRPKLVVSRSPKAQTGSCVWYNLWVLSLSLFRSHQWGVKSLWISLACDCTTTNVLADPARNHDNGVIMWVSWHD